MPLIALDSGEIHLVKHPTVVKLIRGIHFNYSEEANTTKKKILDCYFYIKSFQRYYYFYSYEEVFHTLDEAVSDILVDGRKVCGDDIERIKSLIGQSISYFEKYMLSEIEAYICSDEFSKEGAVVLHRKLRNSYFNSFQGHLVLLDRLNRHGYRYSDFLVHIRNIVMHGFFNRYKAYFFEGVCEPDLSEKQGQICFLYKLFLYPESVCDILTRLDGLSLENVLPINVFARVVGQLTYLFDYHFSLFLDSQYEVEKRLASQRVISALEKTLLQGWFAKCWIYHVMKSEEEKIPFREGLLGKVRDAIPTRKFTYNCLLKEQARKQRESRLFEQSLPRSVRAKKLIKASCFTPPISGLLSGRVEEEKGTAVSLPVDEETALFNPVIHLLLNEPKKALSQCDALIKEHQGSNDKYCCRAHLAASEALIGMMKPALQVLKTSYEETLPFDARMREIEDAPPYEFANPRLYGHVMKKVFPKLPGIFCCLQEMQIDLSRHLEEVARLRPASLGFDRHAIADFRAECKRVEGLLMEAKKHKAFLINTILLSQAVNRKWRVYSEIVDPDFQKKPLHKKLPGKPTVEILEEAHEALKDEHSTLDKLQYAVRQTAEAI